MVFSVAGILGTFAESLAGKRIVFLGDSITQGGTYVGMTSYYLQRLNPEKSFSVIPRSFQRDLVGLRERSRRAIPPAVCERMDRVLEKEARGGFACYELTAESTSRWTRNVLELSRVVSSS